MGTKTYSFLDIAAALVGPGGSISIGAGAGVADEGIDVETSVDRNTMTIGADGTGMHGLNADKSGRITLRLLKTSETNAALMSMANFQLTSGATHGQNTLVINDLARGDVITCRQCAFKKIPTMALAKEAGTYEWSFDAIQIDHLLAA